MNDQAPCWLEGPSPGLVRDAVRRVAPYLSGEVRLNDMLPSSNPFWQRGTAWLGMQFYGVKTEHRRSILGWINRE